MHHRPEIHLSPKYKVMDAGPPLPSSTKDKLFCFSIADVFQGAERTAPKGEKF